MIEREKNISNWDARFYHIYSDEKRVKEVSVETVRKLIKDGNKKVIAVSKTWLNFWYKGNHIGMHKNQVREVLEDEIR